MSGSSASYFATTQYAAESARKLALPFLCPTFDDDAMIDCLRGKEETEIGMYYVEYI